MTAINVSSLTAYLKGVVEGWEIQEAIANTAEARTMTASHIKLLEGLIKDIERGCYDLAEGSDNE